MTPTFPKSKIKHVISDVDLRNFSENFGVEIQGVLVSVTSRLKEVSFGISYPRNWKDYKQRNVDRKFYWMKFNYFIASFQPRFLLICPPLWAVSHKYPLFLLWMCGNPTIYLHFFDRGFTFLLTSWLFTLPLSQTTKMATRDLFPNAVTSLEATQNHQPVYHNAHFTVLKTANENLHGRSRYGLRSGRLLFNFLNTQQAIFFDFRFFNKGITRYNTRTKNSFTCSTLSLHGGTIL